MCSSSTAMRPASRTERRPVGLCLCLGLALLFGCTAKANVITVRSTDSAAITEAIAASQPGQTIQLPAGKYTVTEPIKPKSGTKLIGAGQPETIIHYSGQKPGVMLALTNCEDVEVAHLTLDAENHSNV